MDVLSNLATGFAAAASLQNLFFCLVGCLLGTLIGVLPGIGPVATIAMLLPVTYGMPPLASLKMLTYDEAGWTDKRKETLERIKDILQESR